MKYQVWVKAHDPKTLAVIAKVQVFDGGDRLECERIAETYKIDPGVLFGPVVYEQDPIYSTETRIPGWGPLARNAGAQADMRKSVVLGAGGGGGSGTGAGGSLAKSLIRDWIGSGGGGSKA